MTLRFGIIGSGGMAETWAEAAGTAIVDGRARVSAFAGGRGVRARSEQFRAAAEPTVASLLARDDVDAVVITSPQVNHLEHVLAASAAGKHILCEKPMAMSVDEADAMITAADRAGVTLGVVSQHRFRPTPVAARRLIADGVIGDVRMAQVRGISVPWQPNPKNVPFHDLGAHLCDILRWLVGSEVELIGAQFADYTRSTPPDQTAFLIVRFASGALAHIWFTYEITQPGLGSIMQFLVTGSKGMVEVDSYAACRLGNESGWTTIAEQLPLGSDAVIDPIRIEPYAEQLLDFITATEAGRPPLVSALEGRRTMAMLDAATRSAATGRFERPR